MNPSRQLHKFGGSSLANPECYRRVAKILKEYSKPDDLIVVSAAGKTTNRLIEFLDALNKDGRIAHEILQSLRQFQTQLVTDLLQGELQNELISALNDEFSTLGELIAPLSAAQRSSVLGHGETWSARLLASLLNQNGMPSVAQDSRAFLRAQAGTQPEVYRGDSTLCSKRYSPNTSIIVLLLLVLWLKMSKAILCYSVEMVPITQQPSSAL